MFVGIVVIVVMLVVLVKFTIDDAGKTSLSALIQKCILNYFQVAALLNGLPLRWPQALLDLFSFKGAMSTAGDHLLNPDCSVGDVTAIQLFYSKQIAFLLAPMFLIPIVYLFWKTYALWSVGETWHRDNEDNEDSETYGRERTTVTLKDKFVVTVCILLYLIYPTLCKQAFGLFNCYTVNDKQYLLASLEEECYNNRHTLYLWLVGVPQLVVYVFGLPLLGMVFVWRNRHRLDTVAVRARYSLFFGGYRNDRFYWELVVVMRKVSVIAVATFGSTLDPEMQALVVLLLVMVCYGLQQIGKPYSTPSSNHKLLQVLELSTLAMLASTVWVGLVLFKLDQNSVTNEEDSDGAGDRRSAAFAVREILTVVIVTANIVLVMVLVFYLLRQCVREKVEEKNKIIMVLQHRFSFSRQKKGEEKEEEAEAEEKEDEPPLPQRPKKVAQRHEHEENMAIEMTTLDEFVRPKWTPKFSEGDECMVNPCYNASL